MIPKSTDHKLVMFAQVVKDGKCWRGKGPGTIIAEGNSKQMETRKKANGGNQAGYFVYLSPSKPVGGIINGLMDDSDQPMVIGNVKARLEYLRGEINAERISYDELHELQSLAQYIDASDVQLLEAAGVPEFPEEQDTH